jgi:predicted amidohydrolase
LEEKVKIGLMQFAPALGNVAATMATIERLASEAAGADLVVLPELCNSGYNFVSADQAWQTSEAIGGPFTQFLESLCRRHGFYAVSGLNERDGERLYNSAILVGPGGYRGRYRKLHLFMNELDFFQPGDQGLPVFDLGFCRVGMLVCFDWVYPEAWRVLALAGADVICHPSNLVLPGLAQRAVPIRALTNRVYVITANRVGSEGDLTFTGLSTIAGPRGELLAQTPAEGEAVAVVEADVELARDKQITPRNHLLAGRRPDAYAPLCRDGA